MSGSVIPVWESTPVSTTADSVSTTARLISTAAESPKESAGAAAAVEAAFVLLNSRRPVAAKILSFFSLRCATRCFLLIALGVAFFTLACPNDSDGAPSGLSSSKTAAGLPENNFYQYQTEPEFSHMEISTCIYYCVTICYTRNILKAKMQIISFISQRSELMDALVRLVSDKKNNIAIKWYNPLCMWVIWIISHLK